MALLSFRLLYHLVKAGHHSGHFGPGGNALGVHDAVALAADQTHGVGPGHGLLGIGADLVRVHKAAQVGPLRGLQPQVLGIAHHNDRQLIPLHVLVRTEFALAEAGDDLVLRCPAGGLGIICLRGNSGQSYEGIIFTDGVTEVVYYNQLDERWADLPYGTDNIGGYGCGPTSMAIVVSSLTDQTVDPPTMAEWAYQNGYWCSGNGSYHSLIPGAAEGFGLQWESISTDDPQAVVDALASGKLIVALMSKGHFTSSGHFMVLRGVTSEGKILVADPASKKRSEQEWDISIILDEARKGAAAGGPLWAIY